MLDHSYVPTNKPRRRPMSAFNILGACLLAANTGLMVFNIATGNFPIALINAAGAVGCLSMLLNRSPPLHDNFRESQLPSSRP